MCYAESLLLKSMLTFVEDETLVSFVKAGLKIRTCFISYKWVDFIYQHTSFDLHRYIFYFIYFFFYRECLHILNTRKWENETHRVHFESGIRMGIGAFNLVNDFISIIFEFILMRFIADGVLKNEIAPFCTN